jgi:crossover junction endodeoxyribonuclease RusA
MSGKVIVAWPPRMLQPNARTHWAPLAKAKASYRESCGWLTKQAGIKLDPLDWPTVEFTFVPPNRRKHDLDNLLAAMKSGIDGMAEVIGCDDSRWRLVISRDDINLGGFVRVEFRT